MPVDFCILGAGLAGLTIADKLSEYKKTVTIVDPNNLADGASGVPVGLVNAATGRYSSLAWNGIKGYKYIVATLKKIQSTTSQKLFDQTGIIRPAPNLQFAKRMRESFETTKWPDGWIYWLDKDELQAKYPNLDCVEGGIWLPLDLNVYMPEFLEAYKNYLIKKGVNFHFNSDYKLNNNNNNNWDVHLASGETICTKNLITAAGVKSSSIKQWEYLPLHPVKGQIAILQVNKPYPYKSTVYNTGYALKYKQNKIIAGSTYEHNFENEKPNKEGKNRLLKNLKLILPNIEESIVDVDMWAGLRASSPNRLPILGRHPKYKNSYIFTGFGSKGLLYSSYLSEVLCQFIIEDAALPKSIDVSRLNKHFVDG